jgi:23S rRNA-/tRNA-specific pseudouridylate synthase
LGARETIEILYEDDMILLANKPAGIPIHETKDPHRPDFTRYLQTKYGYEHLRTVNRLDLGTSGIVILGKNPEKNKEIDEFLKNAEKEYILIGRGIPTWKENKFECFLKDGNKKVTTVRSGGKKAITIFRVLAVNIEQKLYLASAKLITGRRHQIRISSSLLGYPIVGDNVYGVANDKAKRLFLHSYKMKLLFENQSEREILSPPPEEFFALFPKLEGFL